MRLDRSTITGSRRLASYSMGDWLVILGAAAISTGCALMFGALMELRNKRGDQEAVAALLETGVVGNLWVRLAVQVLVTAGLVLVTVGVWLGTGVRVGVGVEVKVWVGVEVNVGGGPTTISGKLGSPAASTN